MSCKQHPVTGMCDGDYAMLVIEKQIFGERWTLSGELPLLAAGK